jgi:Flp pilus assembly protein CpaB
VKPSPVFLFLRFLRARRRLVAALLVAVSVYAGLAALRPGEGATVDALVTLRPVAGGTRLGPDDVAVARLPADAVPPEALSDPVAVTGRALTVSLPARAVLLPSSVVVKDSLTAPGLAAVPLTLSGAAAGLVEVGDRIDLIAAEPESGVPSVVADAVRVVAIVTPPADRSPLTASAAGPVVLVEVRPEQVARIASLAAQGPLGFGIR